MDSLNYNEKHQKGLARAISIIETNKNAPIVNHTMRGICFKNLDDCEIHFVDVSKISTIVQIKSLLSALSYGPLTCFHNLNVILEFVFKQWDMFAFKDVGNTDGLEENSKKSLFFGNMTDNVQEKLRQEVLNGQLQLTVRLASIKQLNVTNNVLGFNPFILIGAINSDGQYIDVCNISLLGTVMVNEAVFKIDNNHEMIHQLRSHQLFSAYINTSTIIDCKANNINKLNVIDVLRDQIQTIANDKKSMSKFLGFIDKITSKRFNTKDIFEAYKNYNGGMISGLFDNGLFDITDIKIGNVVESAYVDMGSSFDFSVVFQPNADNMLNRIVGSDFMDFINENNDVHLNVVNSVYEAFVMPEIECKYKVSFIKPHQNTNFTIDDIKNGNVKSSVTILTEYNYLIEDEYDYIVRLPLSFSFWGDRYGDTFEETDLLVEWFNQTPYKLGKFTHEVNGIMTLLAKFVLNNEYNKCCESSSEVSLHDILIGCKDSFNKRIISYNSSDVTNVNIFCHGEDYEVSPSVLFRNPLKNIPICVDVLNNDISKITINFKFEQIVDNERPVATGVYVFVQYKPFNADFDNEVLVFLKTLKTWSS